MLKALTKLIVRIQEIRGKRHNKFILFLKSMNYL
jgi:hypothetical protein